MKQNLLILANNKLLKFCENKKGGLGTVFSRVIFHNIISILDKFDQDLAVAWHNWHWLQEGIRFSKISKVYFVGSYWGIEILRPHKSCSCWEFPVFVKTVRTIISFFFSKRPFFFHYKFFFHDVISMLKYFGKSITSVTGRLLQLSKCLPII